MTPEYESAITRRQSRRFDEIAIQKYAMSGLVLMENAGRGVADTLARLGTTGKAVICCGKGNNGGDGFVLARHLRLRGSDCLVLLFADPAELRGDAAVNWSILQRDDAPCRVCGKDMTDESLAPLFNGADWLIDALLGTGSSGEPRQPLSTVIHAINRHGARTLAMDLPSGLDCDTGQPARATVRADYTCTFVAEKIGFHAPGAAAFTGEVIVLDVGAPLQVLAEARSGAAD